MKTALRALISLLWAVSLEAQGTARVETQSFTVRTFDGRDHPAELWRMWVPANRTKPAVWRVGQDSTDWVHLSFVRLRSSASVPAAPIVFLMGGPGIAGTTIMRVPVYWQLFDSLKSVADVIVLDQRGLGYSTPTVDCPFAGFHIPQSVFESDRTFSRVYGQLLDECAKFWRGRGLEPRTYTVTSIADDVDDVRKILGAKRVSLLGFSYGTHIALETVRRHPTSIDRIVLQGTLGPADPVRLPSGFDATFRAIAHLVSADTGSARVTSDLEGALKRVLDTLARAPAIVRIRGPSGDTIPLTIGRDGFRLLVSGRMGDRRMPAMVVAASQGDWSIATRILEGSYNDLMSGAGSLMARAVVCSSSGSSERRVRVVKEAPGSLFGAPVDNHFITSPFCDALGTLVMPRTPSSAVRSDRPALFITGTLDDRTPPQNADEARKGFRNGVHVKVENGGHELLPLDSVQRMVIDFFRGTPPSVTALHLLAPRYLSIEEARLPQRLPGR
jgi:pimeloyl-ACP methyl ester carboxylesterase